MRPLNFTVRGTYLGSAEMRVSSSQSGSQRPSFAARTARRRAVRQCQVSWVALFGGDGSPSNQRLERAVTRLRWRAASAVGNSALASRWMRLRAAAQARR
jgi:hypothetical protein